MQRYTIYGTNMTSREKAHQYLAEMLDLPEYYGGNLDALYDVLTEDSRPVEITLFQSAAVLSHLGQQLQC